MIRFIFRGEMFTLKLENIPSKSATPSDVEIWNAVAIRLAQLAGWSLTTTVSPAQMMRTRLLSDTHPRVIELNRVANGVDDAVEQPQRAENEKIICDLQMAWRSVEVVRTPVLPDVPLTHQIRYAVLAKDIEAAKERFLRLVRSQARSAGVSEDGEEVEQMRAAGAFAVINHGRADGPGDEPGSDDDEHAPLFDNLPYGGPGNEPQSEPDDDVPEPPSRRVRARLNLPVWD